jgi:hypothetical protein
MLGLALGVKKKGVRFQRIHGATRIKPIPCGLRECENGDTGRPIVEIARDPGQPISLS